MLTLRYCLSHALIPSKVHTPCSYAPIILLIVVLRLDELKKNNICTHIVDASY